MLIYAKVLYLTPLLSQLSVWEINGSLRCAFTAFSCVFSPFYWYLRSTDTDNMRKVDADSGSSSAWVELRPAELRLFLNDHEAELDLLQDLLTSLDSVNNPAGIVCLGIDRNWVISLLVKRLKNLPTYVSFNRFLSKPQCTFTKP